MKSITEAETQELAINAMSLIQSSLSLRPLTLNSFTLQNIQETKVFPNYPSFKFSLIQTSHDRAKVPLFRNENKCSSSRRNNNGQLSVLYDGYPYFPSPHHPLELDMLAEAPDCSNEGIGIVEFFQGKNIFITGATGLVGKAFIEKLLRSTSVGKIYLLIKAENKEAAIDRLTKEITDSELFKCLREEYGNSYQAFVWNKLVPVPGNICEPNLGMDANYTRAIMKDVDVIIESAASTTLNERYDVLLDINAIAPQRMMRLAKACKNLKLFVHISTAYVNGRKQGLLSEKPLVMGENARNDDNGEEVLSSSCPRLDLADEISLAMKSCRASQDCCDMAKDLKRLGMERANLFGWYNTYHSTKAMGEMALNEIRGDVPLLVIRPSVIESSYKEPYPGWIQGNRMFDPVIVSYGKGQLPAFMADPQMHMDIIPIDMAVNSTIAAIAKHGTLDKPQSNVYHVASGVVNPLSFSDFFEIMHEYFSARPLFNTKNIKKIKFYDNFNDFCVYTREEMSPPNGMGNAFEIDGEMFQKLQKQSKPKVAYAENLCKLYEFLGFYNGRFDTSNTQKLLKEMSKKERLEFEIDATKIDWRKYFSEIHIPGLEKHVLNRRRLPAS